MLPRPSDIEARRAALRLTKKELAALAGLDETTVWRVLSENGDALNSTLTKLAGAIEREELRVLRHLSAIYPAGPSQGAAA